MPARQLPTLASFWLPADDSGLPSIRPLRGQDAALERVADLLESEAVVWRPRPGWWEAVEVSVGTEPGPVALLIEELWEDPVGQRGLRAARLLRDEDVHLQVSEPLPSPESGGMRVLGAGQGAGTTWVRVDAAGTTFAMEQWYSDAAQGVEWYDDSGRWISPPNEQVVAFAEDALQRRWWVAPPRQMS